MCTPSCTDVHKQSVYATHTHWFLSIQSKFKLPLSSFVSMTWSKKTANREIKNFFHLFFLYSYYFCRFFSYIEHTDDVLCAEDTIKTVALRTTGNETRYEIPKKRSKTKCERPNRWYIWLWSERRKKRRAKLKMTKNCFYTSASRWKVTHTAQKEE